MANSNYVTGVKVVVVPATMSYVVLMPASMRQAFSIFNNSTGQLYLRFGDNPMTDWTTKIGPNQLYETTLPLYRGVVCGKWDNTVGDAHITEFS